MKKKTIAALLVAPIVVSLLTYVTVTVLINNVAVDISDIAFGYRDNEGFKISDESYPLVATAVYDENQIIKDESKTLVWEVENPEAEEVCRIEEDGEGNFSLLALSEGEARVTVTNETRTKAKSFTAHCYENGVILINDTMPSSGESLASQRRYGQYDLEDGKKVPSQVQLDVEVLVDGKETAYEIEEITDNIRYDAKSERLTLLDGGEARFTFASIVDDSIRGSYSFEIIDEGVNVRSYDDLLLCTNKSKEGEVVVMQTSLGSLRDTYLYDLDADGNPVYRDEYRSSTMRLFGHYDFQSEKFSFDEEVYRFESTYATDFIDQYNAWKGNEEVSKLLVAGVHVQKDFYGNGYTINLHNLAYPNNGSYQVVGGGSLLAPGEGDLFQGPLAFVSLGEIGPKTIIESFGQDNCGFFVDGDGIDLVDLRLQNTDNQSNLYDYFYTGSVVDIEGKDNTIRDCVLQNGKNVVRAFSSDGLLIDNSILQNAGEFLLYLGNNEHNDVDRSKKISYSMDGQSHEYDFSSFMDRNYDEKNPETMETADYNITQALTSGIDSSAYLPFMQGMQEALDNTDGYYDKDGNVLGTKVTVQDTFFSTSAVYSIAFDTLFNGGYLYNGMPSMVSSLLEDMVLAPKDIGGTSLPVHLDLVGDVRFYDWKTVESMDLSGLILQNLSTLASQVGDLDIDISIDDFFPVKPLLSDLLSNTPLMYRDQESGKNYFSSNVIFYGGGNNLSSVSFDGVEDMSDEIDIDFASAVMKGTYAPQGDFGKYFAVLAKAVVAVTGTHPFRTYVNGPVSGTPEYFGKTPSIQDLRRGGGR